MFQFAKNGVAFTEIHDFRFRAFCNIVKQYFSPDISKFLDGGEDVPPPTFKQVKSKSLGSIGTVQVL